MVLIEQQLGVGCANGAPQFVNVGVEARPAQQFVQIARPAIRLYPKADARTHGFFRLAPIPFLRFWKRLEFVKQRSCLDPVAAVGVKLENPSQFLAIYFRATLSK
jgi:hypothetical protein